VSKVWVSLLVLSLVVTGILSVELYQRELRDREALGYIAETAAYHLTEISMFDQHDAFADPRERMRLYVAMNALIEDGWIAQRLAVYGEPSGVKAQLGELPMLLWEQRLAAGRLALSESGPDQAEDEQAIIQLAQQIRDAGWTLTDQPPGPAGWAVAQGWATLQGPLERLVAELKGRR
jgi:hypothetical protein